MQMTVIIGCVSDEYLTCICRSSSNVPESGVAQQMIFRWSSDDSQIIVRWSPGDWHVHCRRLSAAAQEMSPTSEGASPDYLSIALTLKKSAVRLKSFNFGRRCTDCRLETTIVPQTSPIIVRSSSEIPFLCLKLIGYTSEALCDSGIYD